MFRFVLIFSLLLLMAGCVTAPRTTWVNPNVNPANRQAILDRDGNLCYREALARISQKSIGKPKFRKVFYPGYGNSAAGAFTQGFIAGQQGHGRSSRSSYNARMLAFLRACMGAKGWQEIIIR